MDESAKHIAVFRQKEIRRVWHGNEWWFVITDVIAALTDSANPLQYLRNMRRRDEELDRLFNGSVVQIEPPKALPFDTPAGKRQMLCWGTEAMFRLVQSISSPKAEPFKRWLAKVGYERVREIEDPELATKRTRDLYKAKGYSDEWIERRLRGIAIREELTDEWERRGVEGREYGILTSEIAKATFGVTPSEHKNFEGLKRQNLRDHMTDLEQIFSMLGEASTTEITRNVDARGFKQARSAARRGGAVAGNARKQLENETGKPVVVSDNYLEPSKIRQQSLSKYKGRPER